VQLFIFLVNRSNIKEGSLIASKAIEQGKTKDFISKIINE